MPLSLRRWGRAKRSSAPRCIGKEFHDLARLDATIPHEHRRSVTLFFIFRPWVVSSIVEMLGTELGG